MVFEIPDLTTSVGVGATIEAVGGGVSALVAGWLYTDRRWLGLVVVRPTQLLLLCWWGKSARVRRGLHGERDACFPSQNRAGAVCRLRRALLGRSDSCQSTSRALL